MFIIRCQMIDNILSDWNSTFASHKCRLFAKSVVLHEFAKDAKFTDLTIKLAKAISLPSRQYDGFNHWGCFGNKNCDGVYLVEVGDKYDLVLFSDTDIRFSYGIIVSLAP